jgi:hypothetical protein
MKNIGYSFLLFFFIACQKDIQIGNANSGISGSLARFTTVGERLYAVTTDSLKTYDIANPLAPFLIHKQRIDWNDSAYIETLFAFNGRLFIGSRTAMFLYSLSANGVPKYEGQHNHGWGCDPVVANDSLAFVTTRNGRACLSSGFVRANELHVLNVKALNFPILLKVYPMTFPAGLGLDGKTLFVCDDGLKVFDTSDPLSLRLIKYFDKMDAVDLIPLDGHLLVIGEKKLTQLNYRNLNNIQLISEFDLKN